MKFIKKFESFISESGPAPSPTKPSHQPDTKPQTPTKPQKPSKPQKPGRIQKPSVDPAPKAENDTKVSELDVAKRFISEVSRSGESVEKYLNK
mgnify:FL=1